MRKEEKNKENGRRLLVRAKNAKIADREAERRERHKRESREMAKRGIKGDDYGTDKKVEKR